ncbi:MAG: AAA family ATPase [Brevinematales bacterium]|jgi:flagellar biosynthesis protein FlhF
MKYAIYEGKSKQEAVDKMFMAARMENRVKETMLIRTYPEERKKFLGLRKETVWIATACIDESRVIERDRKIVRKNTIQPDLFKDEETENTGQTVGSFQRMVNSPVLTGARASFAAGAEKSKKLEEEVKNLKTSLEEIQSFIKSEFEEIKDGLIKTSRNASLENKKKIIQDLEISQKNIQWCEDFLMEREFHPGVIHEILEYLKTQKNEILIDKTQIIATVRDFFKTNIIREDILMENYSNGKNILFVGPTGVGKTVSIIKMAAHIAVIRQKSLRFISIDRYKVGADSQLKTYSDLMKAPFYPINKEEQFYNILEQDEAHYTFIDTAGKSPKDTIVIRELSDWLKKTKLKFDIHLVVSATTKPRDLDLVIDSYSCLDFAHIIATKLDETMYLGSVVSSLYKTKKPLSFVTNGQGVPEDFEIANVDRLIADSLK